jgi:hypothetical protein
MKNKLSDLNNHLFAQLERLNDEDLSGDKLQEEITRSKAIASVATRIIENAAIVLDSQKVKLEYDRTGFQAIPLLDQSSSNEKGHKQ